MNWFLDTLFGLCVLFLVVISYQDIYLRSDCKNLHQVKYCTKVFLPVTKDK